MEYFFNLFDKYGLPALIIAALMWYIWQKDKMLKETLTKITTALNRNTAAIETVSTHIVEGK